MSNEQTAWKVDRTGWKSGEWDGEPDKVQFRTDVGLPGLIVRNESGGLCGYVGVPRGHAFYGASYMSKYALDANGEETLDRLPNPVDDLRVHGGITFADKCMADGPVCHVPEPGEPDDVWWLGFDCAHAGDYSPADSAREDQHPCFRRHAREDYRDMAYVRREVELLAEQLSTPDRGET